MFKYNKEDIERRINKYGCDGYCYGCNLDLPKRHRERKEMCPRVEYCTETRLREFKATIIACLGIIFGIPFILFLLGLLLNS